MVNDSEKIVKMLRLATDSRTHEEEAYASLRAVRRSALTWDDIKKSILDHTIDEYNQTRCKECSPEHERMERMKAQESFEDGRLYFGKYKGHLISEVAREDLGYIIWVTENCDKINSALRAKLEQAVLIFGKSQPV